MPRLALLSLLLAAIPVPAAAASSKGDKPATAPPVTLAAPCAALTAGAAYVPGVDVEGHAVVPADLPRATALPSPDTVAIELDARIAQSFGASVPNACLGRAVLGTITVRDGQAYFNGAPLAPAAHDAVIAACRAATIAPHR